MASFTITPLDVGRLRLDLTESYGLDGDHPDAGPCDIPLIAYHVATPERSVLVDAPACVFDGPRALYAVPGYVPPAGLTDQLTANGISPEEIDAVVITHAHFDHFNALTCDENGRRVPQFANARHYIGAPDFDPECFGDIEQDTLGIVDALGRLTKVEGELDIGAGLTIRPAPGETPGHQILHVHAGDRHALIVGDLFHQVLELRERGRNVVWADGATATRSKNEIAARAAASDAAVYFAHISTPYRVRRVGDSHVWTAA